MRDRWRAIECATLFWLLPGLAWACDLRHEKRLAFAVIAVYCLVLMWRSRALRGAALWRIAPRDLRGMAVRVAAVAVACVVITWLLHPEWLFAFPRLRPQRWLMVMVLYPLLSALPQELVYRAFFFERYTPLLGNGWQLLTMNVLCFAWLHVMYDNPIAVLASLAGGCLLTWSYARSRSLLLVGIEHGLYGCIAFSVGLGRFFYEG